MPGTLPIPDWNVHGVLPPYLDGTRSAGRTPYRVSLPDVVLRFATSAHRCVLLKGYLEFRKAIHDAGLQNGFQWLDGSFMEDIETLESRQPKDIDVLTFYHETVGISQLDLMTKSQLLFSFGKTHRDARKAQFGVDSIVSSMSGTPEELIERSTYWYSMWAHRRTDLWKGYLQVDLQPIEDQQAKDLLDTLAAKLTTP